MKFKKEIKVDSESAEDYSRTPASIADKIYHMQASDGVFDDQPNLVESKTISKDQSKSKLEHSSRLNSQDQSNNRLSVELGSN